MAKLDRSDREVFAVGSLAFAIVALALALVAVVTAAQSQSRSNVFRRHLHRFVSVRARDRIEETAGVRGRAKQMRGLATPLEPGSQHQRHILMPSTANH